MGKFPIIELRGSPREIGLEHGKALAERIYKTLEFYLKIFPLGNDELKRCASKFRERIFSFNPAYGEEIEAIAEGAKVDARLIYALNARTEILSLQDNECTALFFKESALLGQNWDWAQELESLAVLMKITRLGGHKILMMTEPGIIGKIGLNSAGLGVCLNIMRCGARLDGLPIHIVLRAVLDSKSTEDAMAHIHREKSGKASNILIGDSKGGCVDVEFAGDDVYIQTAKDYFIHTNHYTAGRRNIETPQLPSSISRYNRANEIMKSAQTRTIDDMKKILLDQERSDLPICRPYTPSAEIGSVGTICSIILDLKNRRMNITRGNPRDNQFEAIPLL